MARRRSRLFLLAGVLLLVWGAGFAAAQSDDAETREDAEPEDAATEPADDVTTDDDGNVVYTTDYLKKRFAEEPGEAVDDIITNESLDEQTEETPQAPSSAYTNQDLQQRFGSAEPAEAQTPATEPAEAPAVTEPGEPPLPPEERARQIAEIDAELERLEKRLVAVRNPLLAGTAPATEEERAEEQGMDNAERLRRIEAKIEELQATLEELRSHGD
jgi:hypothetical protein